MGLEEQWKEGKSEVESREIARESCWLEDDVEVCKNKSMG